MADIEKLFKDLKTARDELRLQLHLASKEAEDEWDELQEAWHKFLSRSELDRSADEVGEAARELGLKLKAAYDRMKQAID